MMLSSRRTRMITALAAAAMLAIAVGCGGSAEPTGGESAAVTQPAGGEENARTLAIPGEQGGAMPPGHPPTGQGGDVVWDVPSSWTTETPSSNMRVAQYRVPGTAGDGECVVFYFGPGQGGDPVANARRWANQFSQPDGSSPMDAMKMDSIPGAHLEASLVEVTGTYDGGMTMTAAPAEPQPGWMLLGGIVVGPDAPWFFKFTGPEATVRENHDAFVDMLESVRVES